MSNENISAAISSKIDGLTVEIQQALQALRGRNQNPKDGDAAIGEENSRIMNNLEACVVSAEKMVSSAATIVSSRSSCAGSEFGEEMDESARKRVELWIQPAIVFEDPNEYLPATPLSPSTNETQSTTQSCFNFFNDDRAETVITSLTSPSSEYGKAVYGQQLELGGTTLVASPDNVIAEEFPWQSSSALQAPNVDEPAPTDTEALTPTTTALQKRLVPLDIPAIEVRPIEPVNVTNYRADSDSDSDDDFASIWRKSGMSKFKEKDYAGAEVFLEKSLKQLESQYGHEFHGKEEILGTLGSACAHQGKKDKIFKILDEYTEPANWRHKVLEILISRFLEEEKWTEANETLAKYEDEFRGKDDSLARLVSTCSKQGGWSVAANITGKYLEFRGRDRVLQICISACREKSKWNEAEGFLLELLKDKTRSESDAAESMHTLAEVYLAKKDLVAAQDFCQKAVDARKRTLGKKHPLYLESIYLIAKIIYESGGCTIEYESYRGLLPQKFQGILFHTRDKIVSDCRTS